MLLLGSLVMIFPFWWMLVTSLSTPAQASASATAEGFHWWPTDAQWRNFPTALRQMGSLPWYGFIDARANTVVITTLSVVGQILSCSLVGYAFARARFRGRDTAFILMIATMMLPAQVTMIPMFLMFRSFGWIDTFLPLVVPLFFAGVIFARELMKFSV